MLKRELKLKLLVKTCHHYRRGQVRNGSLLSHLTLTLLSGEPRKRVVEWISLWTRLWRVYNL
jgi:hypothetical protein